MRARARGDLVCCSCNYVAENIVRVGLRGTTYTGALRRPARSGHTILAPLRLRPRREGEAGPAPEAGCRRRSSRRRGNLKPYTRNLSPCRTAICASAPMPCQCHVARTCRPLKLTLDLCLHAPASPIPCAEAGRSMSRPHRPRRRRLLCRVPSRSPAPCVVVSPMPICAVARPRAACCSPPSPQLAHAMCRGWPKSRPHLPRRRRTLMPHVPLHSTAPPSASPPSHAVCRCARLRLLLLMLLHKMLIPAEPRMW